jgi:CheY-like chemotaxis protein
VEHAQTQKFHRKCNLKSIEVQMARLKLILIVDDYEDDAKLLQVLLTNCGIANPIRIALSAEEAMNYLAGGPPFADRSVYPLPEVVFVDLKLPGISGFDLLRWMKAHPELKHMFVVVLSATGDLTSVQAAYALGTNTFLIKPCRAADLENLVICYPAFWERTVPAALLPPPSNTPSAG